MRALLALSILAVVAAGGCRMCASPYDYCGPVLEDGCTSCGSGYGGPMPAREGSYEEGAPMMQGSPSGQPTPAVAPAPKPSMQMPNGSMPSASRPSNSPSTPRSGGRPTSTRYAYGDPDERQSAVQHWQNYQR